jgi:hypothetical protein
MRCSPLRMGRARAGWPQLAPAARCAHGPAHAGIACDRVPTPLHSPGPCNRASRETGTTGPGRRQGTPWPLATITLPAFPARPAAKDIDGVPCHEVDSPGRAARASSGSTCPRTRNRSRRWSMSCNAFPTSRRECANRTCPGSATSWHAGRLTRTWPTTALRCSCSGTTTIRTSCRRHPGLRCVARKGEATGHIRSRPDRRPLRSDAEPGHRTCDRLDAEPVCRPAGGGTRQARTGQEG